MVLRLTDTLVFSIVARVIVTPVASLNLFSSREQEFEQRALLLKRLNFVIFCSDVDQYHKFMPDIQGENTSLTQCPLSCKIHNNL